MSDIEIVRQAIQYRSDNFAHDAFFALDRIEARLLAAEKVVEEAIRIDKVGWVIIKFLPGTLGMFAALSESIMEWWKLTHE